MTSPIEELLRDRIDELEARVIALEGIATTLLKDARLAAAAIRLLDSNGHSHGTLTPKAAQGRRFYPETEKEIL